MLCCLVDHFTNEEFLRFAFQEFCLQICIFMYLESVTDRHRSVLKDIRKRIKKVYKTKQVGALWDHRLFIQDVVSSQK